LAEDLVHKAVLPSLGRLVLEIDVDGAPVQLEPPCAVEVIEATPEEWAILREGGYELHGTPPPHRG
jgi:hypothetical protein